MNDLRTVLQANYLYFAGRSQRAIAEQMRLSPSKVSRLLADAREYVELRYNLPNTPELEGALLARYATLSDAVVVETGRPEIETAIVGQTASKYFLANVADGDRVALACGETLLEMLKALPTQQNMKLRISQLSVEGDPETIHQAPAALVALLRAKASEASKVFGLQLPPPGKVPGDVEYRHALRGSALVEGLRRDALRANVVFVGVGTVRPFRENGPHSFLRAADKATGGAFTQKARSLGIVGEINNRPYDGTGRDCAEEVPGLTDGFISLLTLDDLRRLSKRSKVRVVAVAAGLAKVAAIRVALETGICNVLITGSDVAEELVRTS